MHETMTTTRRRRMRQLPILIILAVALAGMVLLRDVISFETLRENRAALMALRDAHYLFAVLGFMLAYVAVVTFSLPGAALATITGGFLFGIFPGVVYTVTSATMGAVLLFLAARMGFGDQLGARIDAREGRLRRLREAIRENEIPVLFLVRLVPVFPFFVTNLALSVFGVSAMRFTVTTFLGIIPGGLAYTSVGAGLDTVIARGEQPDLAIVFQPHILGPILALAALAALPLIIKVFRKRII